MDLERTFTNLIAENEGIKPEDITIEWIEGQRKNNLYPNARFNIGGYSGSYNLIGLFSLTRRKMDEIESVVF